MGPSMKISGPRVIYLATAKIIKISQYYVDFVMLCCCLQLKHLKIFEFFKFNPRFLTF